MTISGNIERDSPCTVKREHLVAIAVAVSLHAGLATALTLATPPEPLEIKLDLGFEMVDLAPAETAERPSIPLLKEMIPAEALPPEAENIAPAKPPVPLVKKIAALPPESIPEPLTHEMAIMPVPAPAESSAIEPSMLTAEQAKKLPLLLGAIDEDYIPPLSSSRYLHNPKPRYPRAARKRGMEGVVIINVRVSRDGRPVETLLHTSSGYGVLDRAALKTVRSWRFEAARRGNARIEGEVLVPIHFKLTNS